MLLDLLDRFTAALKRRTAIEHEIGPDIFLTDTDRDNWFVRLGTRHTRIYAPPNSWSGKSVDFCGVVGDHWHPPHDHEHMAPADKARLENALKKHLTSRGIQWTQMED